MNPQTHRRIRSILTLWEEFDLVNPYGSPTDFAKWILAQEKTKDAVNEEFKINPESETASKIERMYEFVDGHYPIQVRISIAITKIWRVLRNQLKQTLSPIGMPNVDDFHYLASMYKMESPTKSELILSHMHEITTGTEIIKRLINQGWMEEHPHPSDKRSKVLKLTKAGIAQIELGFSYSVGVSMKAYSVLDTESLQKLKELLVAVELANTKHLFVQQNEVEK